MEVFKTSFILSKILNLFVTSTKLYSDVALSFPKKQRAMSSQMMSFLDTTTTETERRVINLFTEW